VSRRQRRAFDDPQFGQRQGHTLVRRGGGVLRALALRHGQLAGSLHQSVQIRRLDRRQAEALDWGLAGLLFVIVIDFFIPKCS
jgi:hypothetical protein